MVSTKVSRLTAPKVKVASNPEAVGEQSTDAEYTARTWHDAPIGTLADRLESGVSTRLLSDRELPKRLGTPFEDARGRSDGRRPGVVVGRYEP